MKEVEADCLLNFHRGPLCTVGPDVLDAYITPAPPELSKDAFMVRELQRELARQGCHGDIFAWVHQYDPAWSRARWERATAELAQAQIAWQHANVLNRLGDLTGVGDALDCLGVCVAEEDSIA